MSEEKPMKMRMKTLKEARSEMAMQKSERESKEMAKREESVPTWWKMVSCL